IVQKAGAWFSMGETRLGQGRDNAKLYFKEHPEEAEQVHKQIEEAILAERAEAAKKGLKQPLAKAKDGDDAEAPKPPKAAPVSSAKAVSIDADDFDDDLEV
ncbi:MAG: DNA recombination/repair protein RecA, partial [Butyricicoccus sp.]